MEEEMQKDQVVNHFEKDSHCQVFNGDIHGAVFAMPGSTVHQHTAQASDGNEPDGQPAPAPSAPADEGRTEELCHFIHPSVGSAQEWAVHDEVQRLVRRHGVQEICQYLQQMSSDHKLLLPQMPSVAYAELVRLGMPSGEGYSEKYFTKLYKK